MGALSESRGLQECLFDLITKRNQIKPRVKVENVENETMGWLRVKSAENLK